MRASVSSHQKQSEAVLLKIYAHTTGIRDLEQAAEHIAANALYRIEVNKVENVTFDVAMVEDST